MGPAYDRRSVVDPRFRVLGGIKGLRVVDGSVMPEIVSGNTNAPIIMMAERCADFIKGQTLPPVKIAPRIEKRVGEAELTDSNFDGGFTDQSEGGVTNVGFVEDTITNLIEEGKKRKRRSLSEGEGDKRFAESVTRFSRKSARG